MAVQLLLVEIVLERVLRPYLKGVDGDGLPFYQLPVPEQRDEMPEGLLERRRIVLSEIGDLPCRWPEALQ